VGRSLLGANVPKPDDGNLAAALLGVGNTAEVEFSPPERSAAFEDAGVYVLASNRATSREVFVLADAGPHGYLSIAAHAHADALSFSLSAGGQPFLIDPGTFVYHTEPEWRRYFRGTSAHNTVVIDGEDQSTQAGPFLWSDRARTTTQSWTITDSGARLVASHDGYARRGVIHQRHLELQENKLIIVDQLQGSGTHQITLCFHTAPECQVAKDSDSALTVSRGHISLRLRLPEKLQVELVRGAKTAGWYSPRFGVKEETVSILVHGRGSIPASLKTTVEVFHEH
jgi:uncharacterized heparinase superfamily protein